MYTPLNIEVIPRYDLHPDWVEFRIQHGQVDNWFIAFAPGVKFKMSVYTFEVIEQCEGNSTWMCKIIDRPAQTDARS